MNEVLEKIQKIGLVPVVVLEDAKDAAPLAKALCEGGLPCAEVTFRTAAAEDNRAGRPCSGSGREVYRKPWTES